MENLKRALEVADVFVKIAIAVIAFFVLGAARHAYELQKMQYDLQQQQATIQKTQAESAKLLAEQTKAMAEAQTVTRKEDAALVTLIVDLLFKQNLQCRTEDQAVMIEFLVEINDHYNQVKLGNRMPGAFARRRACEQNPAIVADARLTTEHANGLIPDLSAANVKAMLSSITQTPEFKAAASATVEQRGKGADGFVALGRSAGAKGFTNFEYAGGTPMGEANVAAGSVWRAKWAVYLRTNTNNTEEGSNPILGVINEKTCVRVIEAFPNIRGQTWAAVGLVPCSS